MGDAARNVKADDVPLGVDPRGSGRRGARGIDRGEFTLVVSQEAMLDAAGKVAADDIGLRADT